MNVVLRAAAILTSPTAEWLRIEKEPDDPVYLLFRYVAVLALVPPVFSFLGDCIIGAIVPGVGVVRASVFDGIFGAIFNYLESFAAVALLALIVDLAAALFGARRGFANAFKVAAYSCTPLWLSGVFLLLPGLRFLTLSGFYGSYLLLTGLPLLMRSPAQKTPGFAALVTAFACALAFIATAGQRALFGTPGL